MPEQVSFRPYLISTLLLGAGGWIGLFVLMNYGLPTYWPRWGFFILLYMASTGTALPFSFLLNRHILKPFHGPSAIREASWVGFYVTTLAWLQLGRSLNSSLGIWLALGIVIIEALLRPRSEPDSQPRPDDESGL